MMRMLMRYDIGHESYENAILRRLQIFFDVHREQTHMSFKLCLRVVAQWRSRFVPIRRRRHDDTTLEKAGQAKPLMVHHENDTHGGNFHDDDDHDDQIELSPDNDEMEERDRDLNDVPSRTEMMTRHRHSIHHRKQVQILLAWFQQHQDPSLVHAHFAAIDPEKKGHASVAEVVVTLQALGCPFVHPEIVQALIQAFPGPRPHLAYQRMLDAAYHTPKRNTNNDMPDKRQPQDQTKDNHMMQPQERRLQELDRSREMRPHGELWKHLQHVVCARKSAKDVAQVFLQYDNAFSGLVRVDDFKRGLEALGIEVSGHGTYHVDHAKIFMFLYLSCVGRSLEKAHCGHP